MRLRAHGQTETDDGRDIETELRRQVLMLWQTALVRLSRLQISDEIAVGLRYFSGSVLRVVPKVNAEVRDALRSRWPDADLLANRFCGPDRGSAATATATPTSPPRGALATGSAAYTALDHYLAD